MCTIVLARNVIPGYPIAVVANRDEYLSRPSEQPDNREVAGTAVLAPKDSVRGGTWIGVNQFGVFAGLTNRNGIIGKPGKISRGDLPNFALSYPTAQEAFERLRDKYQDGTEFNGFFLVIADAKKAYLFGGDGVHLTHREVTENVLAVTNRGIGTVGAVGLPETPRRVTNIIGLWPKIQAQLEEIHKNPPESPTVRRMYNKMREAFQAKHPNTWQQSAYVNELVKLLHIHDEDRHGTCVNEPENNYGTKSSSIILLDEKSYGKPEWLYWHRERQGDEHICNYYFDQHVLELL